MEYLQILFEENLGKDVILFTVDGDSEHELSCGSLPSLYTTVDFGPGKPLDKTVCIFTILLL